MSCTHNLTRSPCTEFTSCRFRTITKRYYLQKADVICGVLEAEEHWGEVAVKGYCADRGTERHLVDNEIMAWRLLCPHPNIASFIGTAPINHISERYLPVGPVSGYCHNGDLTQYLQRIDPDRNDLSKRLQLLVGVVQGLRHAHEQSVVHGDLKGANILADATGRLAKICDFGSSTINCTCYQSPTNQDGTTLWDSPELWMEGAPRSKESDVWAFGCVGLEVLFNICPWDPVGCWDAAQIRQMEAGIEGGFPAQEEWLNLGDNEFLHQAWRLLQGCWHEEPTKRSTLDDLLVALQNLNKLVEPNAG